MISSRNGTSDIFRVGETGVGEMGVGEMGVFLLYILQIIFIVL